MAGSTAAVFSLAGCGGGGGGSSDGSGGVTGGGTWKVEASVTSDTCGERISNVTQNFTIDGNLVDTGIVTLTGIDQGNGLTVGFSEANGDCQRTYEATFSDLSSSPSPVTMTSKSACASVTCESAWTGTATQTN